MIFFISRFFLRNTASIIPLIIMAYFFSDPPWFNETWLSKIKENVGSNKILKVFTAICFVLFFCVDRQASL